MIDIIRPDRLSLGELGGLIWKNLKKSGILTYEQSSYFKSQLDPVTLEGGRGGTGNLGKRSECRDWDETWSEE